MKAETGMKQSSEKNRSEWIYGDNELESEILTDEELINIFNKEDQDEDEEEETEHEEEEEEEEK